MASLIFGILKVGQFHISSDPNVQKAKKTAKAFPNQEYIELPYFIANILTVTRISLGDFDFDASTLLNPLLNIIFWISWYCITIIMCVIFLNFIIAEVATSYNSVTLEIDGMVLKERALLIKESEDMMKMTEKTNQMFFPKFLISRELEI